MQDLDYRFGLFAIATAVMAAFLFLADLIDTPFLFENLRYELALAAPLAAWLLCRRAFHWTKPRV